MTNLDGSARTRSLGWLTPERALLVLPLLGGLAVSVGLVLLIVTPLIVQLQTRQVEVERLEAQKRKLPNLRLRFASLAEKQDALELQQDRILALVAGQAQLQTLLAELNELAVQHGILIKTAKPDKVERVAIELEPEPLGSDEQPLADMEKASDQDDLFRQGVEKQSAALTVLGEFPDVYDFLRALERLDVFVAMSNLIVNSELPQDSRSGGRISLSLQLTAYGREPEPKKLVVN